MIKLKICPICKNPGQLDFLPFCSQRCKMVDLGRWLRGDYVIAGKEEEDKVVIPEEDPEQAPRDLE